VVVTSRPRTIYVAGQLARDAQGNIVGKDDIRAQVRQVCENLKAALAAAGATFADIVQTNTYVTSWPEYRKASDIRLEYFGANVPTSTTVQISALAAPEFMVEISCVAHLDA
jgi:2-iminobutanoate/2-iminopropanoate deaminase